MRVDGESQPAGHPMTAIDDVLRKVRDLDEKTGAYEVREGAVIYGIQTYTLHVIDQDRTYCPLSTALNADEREMAWMKESRTLLPRVAKALGILAAAMDKLSNDDGYHVRCTADEALIEAEAALKGEE